MSVRLVRVLACLVVSSMICSASQVVVTDGGSRARRPFSESGEAAALLLPSEFRRRLSGAITYSSSDDDGYEEYTGTAGVIGIVCSLGPTNLAISAGTAESFFCPGNAGYPSSTDLSTIIFAWCVQ
jgi:hypothetical protein